MVTHKQMHYEIIIKPSAQKDLDKLPFSEIKRIASKLEQLRANPRPIGIQKLSDQEGFRIRSGKYRILFAIDDEARSIFVYRLKHRKNVYRK